MSRLSDSIYHIGWRNTTEIITVAHEIRWKKNIILMKTGFIKWSCSMLSSHNQLSRTWFCWCVFQQTMFDIYFSVHFIIKIKFQNSQECVVVYSYYYLNIEYLAKNKTNVKYFVSSSIIIHNRLITDIKRFIVCAIKELLWSRVDKKIANNYSVLCIDDNHKSS